MPANSLTEIFDTKFYMNFQNNGQRNRPIGYSADFVSSIRSILNDTYEQVSAELQYVVSEVERILQVFNTPRQQRRPRRQRRPMPYARPRQPTGPLPLDLSKEISHPAAMLTHQIKQSIEARPETNQDIKFLEKKECSVCLASWKEILLGEKNLVFTDCGHVFCRDCAIRIASEGSRKCALCQKSFVGKDPPFRRLHLPLDPRLKKTTTD